MTERPGRSPQQFLHLPGIVATSNDRSAARRQAARVPGPGPASAPRAGPPPPPAACSWRDHARVLRHVLARAVRRADDHRDAAGQSLGDRMSELLVFRRLHEGRRATEQRGGLALRDLGPVAMRGGAPAPVTSRSHPRTYAGRPTTSTPTGSSESSRTASTSRSMRLRGSRRPRARIRRSAGRSTAGRKRSRTTGWGMTSTLRPDPVADQVRPAGLRCRDHPAVAQPAPADGVAGLVESPHPPIGRAPGDLGDQPTAPADRLQPAARDALGPDHRRAAGRVTGGGVPSARTAS